MNYCSYIQYYPPEANICQVGIGPNAGAHKGSKLQENREIRTRNFVDFREYPG